MVKAKVKAKVETKTNAAVPMFVFMCSGRYFTKLREIAGTRTRQAKNFDIDVRVPAQDIDIFVEKHTNIGKQQDDPKNHLKIVNTTKVLVFRNYGGVLRKKLVPLKLAAVAEKAGGYEDFSRIRDMRVTEVIGLGGARVEDLDLPLNMLSLAQIGIFCSQKGILSDIIDPNTYLSLDDLRADLFEYLDDPEVFRNKVDQGKGKGGKRSAFNEERERERRFREINNIDEGSVIDGKRGVVKAPAASAKVMDNF